MNGFLAGWTDVKLNGWLNVCWLDGWMNDWLLGCMDCGKAEGSLDASIACLINECMAG